MIGKKLKTIIKRLASKQNGFSLTELLVIIVIIVVLSTLAFMQYRASNEKFKRVNIATELKVSFERARFDSVKRRAEATDIQAKVLVSATSIKLITDNNQNAVITDTSDTRTTDFAAQNVVISKYITETATVLPVTVYFNQRGEVTAVDANGATVNPIFYVCNSPYSIASNSNCNIVLVSPTGTVNMLGGGSSPPGFATPPVTSVSATDYLNTFISLFTGTPVPTPTPTATITPTATTTITPTATATVSPTETATVSPTATATVSPTATAAVSPTATATVSPTATATVSPTATATPACLATVPSTSVVFTKNDSLTITVTYSNAPSTTFTVTKGGTGPLTSVSTNANSVVSSITTLTSSGTFNITAKYPNGNLSGSNTITISGCNASPIVITGTYP